MRLKDRILALKTRTAQLVARRPVAAFIAIACAALLLRGIILKARPKETRIPRQIQMQTQKIIVRAKENEVAMRDKLLHETAFPSVTQSTANAFTSGHISIVRDKNVITAAEPPKSPMQLLAEMTGERKQKPTVQINKEDLNRDIRPPSMDYAKTGGKAGRDSSMAKLIAPAHAQIFTSQLAYRAFTEAHATGVKTADFAKQMVLVLISSSQFPSSTLEIVDTAVSDKKITVKYRFNSSEAARASADFYPAVVLNKSRLPVTLEQIQ